jgi:hypothetical protein
LGFAKTWITTLIFEKNAIFSAENGRKSQKIVITLAHHHFEADIVFRYQSYEKISTSPSTATPAVRTKTSTSTAG